MAKNKANTHKSRHFKTIGVISLFCNSLTSLTAIYIQYLHQFFWVIFVILVNFVNLILKVILCGC